MTMSQEFYRCYAITLIDLNRDILGDLVPARDVLEQWTISQLTELLHVSGLLYYGNAKFEDDLF